MRDRRDDSTHRRVAERKLGRKLTKSEVTHHINENKADNTLANIEVKTRSAHTTHHNTTKALSALRKSLRMPAERRKLY